MELSAREASLDAILPWRDMYRLEMSCQITHDSIHYRQGMTQEYELSAGGEGVGYGSVAVGGPWKGTPTIYEYYVVPNHRLRVFDLFRELLSASGAAKMVVQSNAALATAMLHTFAHDVKSQAVLFHDKVTTSHAPPGAVFRTATAAEFPDAPSSDLRWHGAVEVEGAVAATGGILFHYNRPYGDIFMEVAEPYRRRGFGSFLVQELKRVAYEGGHVPAARTNPANLASRSTLQKAGFVPCGHILSGSVPVDAGLV